MQNYIHVFDIKNPWTILMYLDIMLIQVHVPGTWTKECE